MTTASEEKKQYAFYKKQYETLLYTIKDALVVSDRELVIQEANPAAWRMFGLTRKELLQQSVHDLIHPSYREPVNRFVASPPSDRSFECEMRLLRKGKTLPASAELCMVMVCHNCESRILLLFRGKEVSRKPREKGAGSRKKEVWNKTLRAREEERYLIARNIHDSLGQMLTIIRMNAGMALTYLDADNLDALQKALNDTFVLTEEAIAETRNIAFYLSPVNLKFGLVRGIRKMCERISAASRLSIHVSAHEMPGTLIPFFETNLYRICQELINNVVRHAEATECNLQLFYRDDHIVVHIEDNGKGFEYDPDMSEGMGLQNIRSRIEMLNGDLQIDSTEGAGCTVIVEIPLDDGFPGAE